MSVNHLPATVKAVLRALTRFGYAAMGTLYLIIATIAIRTAVNPRRYAPADFSGAVGLLRRGFAGRALGVAVVAGLVANTIARLARAWLRPDRFKRSRLLSLCVRIGTVGTAVFYAGLAYASLRLVRGGESAASEGSDKSVQDWTAFALAQPAGRWALAGVGVGIIAYSLTEWYRAWKARFDGALDLRGLPRDARVAAVQLSRAGMVARAAVLLMVGGFVLAAAWNHDPHSARGLGGTLASLTQHRGGRWLLGLAAAGLFAYGLHELLLATFRRFRFIRSNRR